MTDKRLAVLGGGSMGLAIATQLADSQFDSANISVSTNSAESALRVAENHGWAAVAKADTANANALVAEGADVVLVSVKPAYVAEVLGEIASVLKPGALVVSVAAGITLATMEAVLPAGTAVVRTMPNTPSSIGEGMTGLVRGSSVTDAQFHAASEMFLAVGDILVVEESMIDALSTISGSGPAYVYLFAEKLIAAAEHLGFSSEDAALLVKQTFLGASLLMSESNDEPSELRRRVTSPNGTTMQAIAKFEAGGMDATFVAAVESALNRAKEIAAGK
jgi:pyrroline-5-carboxylate reductase